MNIATRNGGLCDLRLVGWSHRDSALPVLEQVAVPRACRRPLLERLRACGYGEAVVLTTCSRTEVYARQTAPGAEDLLDVLTAHRAGPAGALPPAQTRTGAAVAEHLFRVAAGLDSRVVGEVEIRQQVRGAFREAQTAGLAGAGLTRMFAAALKAASRIHERTGLGAQGRSLGRCAVDRGLEAVGGLPDPFVLVVGSGRMARTAVEHLTRRGVPAHVAARNAVHAARLVDPVRICPLPSLEVGVARADLLICATSASSYVVTAAHVRQAMRQRSRPLTVVDLSVPRNVDGAVGQLLGVRLIDLAGMHDAAADDPVVAALLEQAHDLLRADLQRYLVAASAGAAAPAISAMRERVEQLCLTELAHRRPHGADDLEVAEAARAVAGKLLHGPLLAARAAAAAGDDALLELLGSLFGPGADPRDRACMPVPARISGTTSAGAASADLASGG